VLASLTEDGNVKLWNVSDGSEISEFKVYAQDARQITFSPDGGFLAILAKDELIVWDMDTMREYTSHSLR
jgi:WD40 repeat protein